MEHGPLLVCLEGPIAGQRYEITTAGLRIGRDPGNEIHIEDAGISRQHARVLLHNGAIWVQDAGSRNGIFVNGERVPDHRQVKYGDKLLVGASIFQITAPAVATAPPAPAPVPAPRARWKIWPFAVAILFALGFIVCISWVGSHGKETASAPQAPSYSLSSVMDEQAAAAPAAPSVEQALAVAAGADADAARARLPDPPAGATSAELLGRAQAMYDAGRLNDARTSYQMALKLDPACEICTVRIGRLDTEIATSAQQHLDAGMRYFDSMQIEQAISSWEMVLLLVPDPADPMHVKAADALAKARAGAAAKP
jgi:tetratricopeptide (TPR) repeat protein